ncbi:hypothetical protein CIY_26070 [Butyrivibrio fibrisolvens 16/4]|nr:hypothetical protein CIY_26070 [Butyrivibrio fibrisolvens 16/4]
MAVVYSKENVRIARKNASEKNLLKMDSYQKKM